MAALGKKVFRFSFLAGTGFVCGLLLYLLLLPGWSRPDRPAYPIKPVSQLRPDLENVLVFAPAENLFILSFDQANSCLKLTWLDARSKPAKSGQGPDLLGLYEQGGMGLLINTLNDLLELDLQKYILLDTSFLVDLIDLAGGLELDLAAADLDLISDCLQEGPSLAQTGPQRLTGSQAVCWSQAAPGRQQELLTALLSRTAGWQLPLFVKLADNRQLSWQTNLSLADLVRLGRQGLERRVFWHEVTCQTPGQVFLVDWQGQKEELGRFLEQAGQGD